MELIIESVIGSSVNRHSFPLETLIDGQELYQIGNSRNGFNLRVFVSDHLIKGDN